MNKIINLIEKYLNKRKEKLLVNVIVKNYDNANIYIGLVYNNKIKKYKVLFIPLDVVDNNIEEYVCYQFVNVEMVEYILDNLKDNGSTYENEEFRIRNLYDNYLIEINLFLDNEYKFLVNRYLPNDWKFLYEVIVLLFEHVPHMISELCPDMLSLLNNMDIVEYKMSYNFNLYKDKFTKIFSKSEIEEAKKLYENKQVKFLEYVNNRYYAIVKEHIVIVEYSDRLGIINLYCDADYESHKHVVCAVLLNIINEKFRDFYKISVKENKKKIHYLCYGIDGDNLKVIYDSCEKLIEMDLYKDGTLEIEYDPSGYIETKLNDKLKNS